MKAKRGGGEGKGVDRGKLLKNRDKKKKKGLTYYKIFIFLAFIIKKKLLCRLL